MSPQTEASRQGVASRTPITELADQTRVGDLLIRSLIRAQLGLALRVAAAFAVVLGGLPAMFALFPSLGRFEVGGIPLPWLLLGLASFPLLVLLGALYARQAERNERDFVDLVGHTRDDYTVSPALGAPGGVAPPQKSAVTIPSSARLARNTDDSAIRRSPSGMDH